MVTVAVRIGRSVIDRKTQAPHHRPLMARSRGVGDHTVRLFRRIRPGDKPFPSSIIPTDIMTDRMTSRPEPRFLIDFFWGHGFLRLR